MTGLSSVASISLSGMNAAQWALDSAAHNVANAQTPDFRRQQVDLAAQEGGGVRVTLSGAPDAGENLAADIVDSLQARASYMANLAVFRTGSQMLGSLLDASA